MCLYHFKEKIDFVLYIFYFDRDQWFRPKIIFLIIKDLTKGMTFISKNRTWNLFLSFERRSYDIFKIYVQHDFVVIKIFHNTLSMVNLSMVNINKYWNMPLEIFFISYRKSNINKFLQYFFITIKNSATDIFYCKLKICKKFLRRFQANMLWKCNFIYNRKKNIKKYLKWKFE